MHWYEADHIYCPTFLLFCISRLWHQSQCTDIKMHSLVILDFKHSQNVCQPKRSGLSLIVSYCIVIATTRYHFGTTVPFKTDSLRMRRSPGRHSAFIVLTILFLRFLPCDAMRCTVLVIVILSVRLSVRPSVTLVTVSTWFELRSWFLHHMVDPSF